MRRRPPRVVLWGGRPDVDLQFGSLADRRRARRLRLDAGLSRAGRIMADFSLSTRELAIAVIERSGLGQTARALRAQAEDERRMAELDRRRANPPGIFQQRPPRAIGLGMTSEQSARAFLQRERGSGPPYADPPRPTGKLFPFEEGSLRPADEFHTEWPEDAAAFLFGDDVTPTDIKHSHTFTPSEPIAYTGATLGEITIDVDPDAFGRYLHNMIWPFAVNMGWVAPLGPGGCVHPPSAHALLDGCPGWRRCADCGTTMTPGQAEHAATQTVTIRNPDHWPY